MADFKKAWAITSVNEGGYVNDSDDKGKETYRGISTRAWPKWEGWSVVHKVIIDMGIKSTLDAGKTVWLSITKKLATNTVLDAMVQAFYKKNYWDLLNLDKEEDQDLANQFFDSAVLTGVPKTREAMDKAKKEEGYA